MATSESRCLPSTFSYRLTAAELIAAEPEPLIMVTRLACGETDENELVEWIRVNVSPLLDRVGNPPPPRACRFSLENERRCRSTDTDLAI